ncbi:unnamed protein product, partial [Polarella glacialis]
MAAPLLFQVAVVGGRGAGKSSLIQAIAQDRGVSQDAAAEEEADGFRLQRVACSYGGLSISVDFLELPSDERYMDILPQFGSTAACVVFVVNLGDPMGHSDLSARLAALGSRPPCGLLVVQGSVRSDAGVGE